MKTLSRYISIDYYNGRTYFETMKNKLLKLTIFAVLSFQGFYVPMAKAELILSSTINEYNGDIADYRNLVMAQNFTNGSTDYNLSTVSLDLAYSADQLSSLSAGIYTDISGAPGTLIASLSYLSVGSQQNAYNYINYNPVTFTGSGLMQANTSYWLKVNNPSSLAWMVWYSPVITPTGSGNATVGQFSSDGNLIGGNNIAGFSIVGTPVPEPSTYALFGLGALALVIVCRRRMA